ncbi:tyrosine-type recombinase/integrase [Rhodoplanes sp. SY1]|uniref:tyrosine-type recombinase/integrase n=1 Tax=Rhodoplanes sp. SY1 TaxID=3166646 RepID=UPI0038B595DF
MARSSGLSNRKVETAKPGKYEDGRGLRLVVSGTGARKWVLRYMRAGRRVEMGLGSFPTVTLADARAQATDARRLLDAGRDPLAARRSERAAAAGGATFGAFALTLLDTIEAGFRNEKHRAQWRATLTTYAAPIWSKRLADIDTDEVLACLKPIWQTKPETASRVRGRIERVLDAAAARGLRSRENPARWRGHLANLLPKRAKLSRGHHAAMPFDQVPAFLAKLRAMEGISARALEFAVLTAARSGEVLGARWSEIDLDAKVWTVPASRMKAGREHRVPLTGRCVAILTALAETKVSEFVFPGAKPGKPLSVMALTMVLRRAKRGDLTVHGFRSAFRDWAGERTSFPREIAEAALAHVVGDATERAYRRGDALEKRRRLMEAWAGYCTAPAATSGVVVPLVKRS